LILDQEVERVGTASSVVIQRSPSSPTRRMNTISVLDGDQEGE
jgi:hypothetical protein